MTKKPLDLNEWAYDTIKKMILDNSITAGSQINIDEMTESLQISRTPIREALIRLRQNGLVEARSRVGFFVTTITHAEFKDLFEVRRMLECYAAGRCVALMSDERISELAYHCEKGALAVGKGEISEFNKHEVCFHDLIVMSLDNARINEIRSSLEDQMSRTRMYSSKSNENLRLSVEEHASIMRAIKRRDSKSAEAAMNVHLNNVEDRLSRFLFNASGGASSPI